MYWERQLEEHATRVRGGGEEQSVYARFGSARFYVFRVGQLARLRRSTNGKDFVMAQWLWLLLKG